MSTDSKLIEMGEHSETEREKQMKHLSGIRSTVRKGWMINATATHSNEPRPTVPSPPSEQSIKTKSTINRFLHHKAHVPIDPQRSLRGSLGNQVSKTKVLEVTFAIYRRV